MQLTYSNPVWPGEYYCVYHAWDVAKTARRIYIDPLRWTEAGPQCAGPTTDEQTIEL